MSSNLIVLVALLITFALHKADVRWRKWTFVLKPGAKSNTSNQAAILTQIAHQHKLYVISVTNDSKVTIIGLATAKKLSDYNTHLEDLMQ